MSPFFFFFSSLSLARMCVSVPASRVVSFLVLSLSVCLCSEHRTVLSFSFILGFFFLIFWGHCSYMFEMFFFWSFQVVFFVIAAREKEKSAVP